MDKTQELTPEKILRKHTLSGGNCNYEAAMEEYAAQKLASLTAASLLAVRERDELLAKIKEAMYDTFNRVHYSNLHPDVVPVVECETFVEGYFEKAFGKTPGSLSIAVRQGFVKQAFGWMDQPDQAREEAAFNGSLVADLQKMLKERFDEAAAYRKALLVIRDHWPCTPTQDRVITGILEKHPTNKQTLKP